MHVSRSPSARWQRIAATDESTPPERPQMACPSAPTCARTAAMASSTNEPGVQVGARPATSKRNAPRTSAAARRVDHLGVELEAVDLLLAFADGAERRVARETDRLEAGGERRDPVAVGHPHFDRLALGEAVEHAGRLLDATFAAPYSRSVAASTFPPRRCASELEAVADAEHRDAELEDPRVHRRGAVAVHARRAARRGRLRADPSPGSPRARRCRDGSRNKRAARGCGGR